MFSDGGCLGWSGGWLAERRGQQPGHGRRVPGSVRRRSSWAGVPLLAKFFFELVFCGTSATIVSGSVNERMKYTLVPGVLADSHRGHLPDRGTLGLGRRLSRAARG